MNNSVKAKAAEASLVSSVTHNVIIDIPNLSGVLSFQLLCEGETAEEMAKCFHRSLLLQ